MDFFLPLDLEEALEIKSVKPESVPIAGGTDLMVDLNFGRRRPAALMDVTQVPALVEWRADGPEMFMGAGVTYSRAISEMPACPPLAAASRTIGSPQIRNRATIGGNLGTASPAGDALPVLATFDAEIVIAGKEQVQRFVPWDDFLLGPRRNGLQPHELIVGARWRRVRGPGVFLKVGPRNAMVIAVASLCLVLDPDRERTRVAVGSVAPTVIRVPSAESLIDEVLRSVGSWANPGAAIDQAGIEDAAEALRRTISPIDDLRGNAGYRRHVCGVLLRRALSWALDELGALERGKGC